MEAAIAYSRWVLIKDEYIYYVASCLGKSAYIELSVQNTNQPPGLVADGL